MASDVTVQSAINSAQATQSSTVQLAEDFSEFLNLLTVQLQNQDPLSPMDTTEFTNQLVAFTGVEQQINTNQKLDDLVSLGLGTSFSTSLNYVGLDVSYLSSEVYYDGSKPVEFSYAIDGVASSTTVNIYSEDGELVYSQQVSDDEGVEAFTWDGSHKGGGTVEPGTYSISIDALDAEGQALDTSTVVTGHVRGIETQNGLTYLLVGERAVSVGNIINASEPLQTASDDSGDGEDSGSDTGTTDS